MWDNNLGENKKHKIDLKKKRKSSQRLKFSLMREILFFHRRKRLVIYV